MDFFILYVGLFFIFFLIMPMIYLLLQVYVWYSLGLLPRLARFCHSF